MKQGFGRLWKLRIRCTHPALQNMLNFTVLSDEFSTGKRIRPMKRARLDGRRRRVEMSELGHHQRGEVVDGTRPLDGDGFEKVQWIVQGRRRRGRAWDWWDSRWDSRGYSQRCSRRLNAVACECVEQGDELGACD